MKTKIFSRFIAVLTIALSLVSSTRAEVLLDCPNGNIGDLLHRGFYVVSYPGTSMESVQMGMSASVAGSYEFRMVVREGTYDGPILGSITQTAVMNGDRNEDRDVTFSFPSIPVPKGQRICFLMAQISGPGLLYYSVNLGSSGCPDVIQTEDTSAPLSTPRNNGLRVLIEGENSSVVSPGGSIQAYIDAASVGDVVVVEPGTYNEDLVLRSGVSVRGAGAGRTILQGTQSGNTIIAIHVDDAQFEGFTVTGSGSENYHSAIYIYGGNVMFNNNRVTGNINGIEVFEGSSAILRDNTIDMNGQLFNGFANFGISCSISTPLIANNIIVNNIGDAVQIWHDASDAAQVINNTIADNWGSGVKCDGNADPVVKNNIIVRNGTGILADHGAAPRSTFNDVWGNSVAQYQSLAGIAQSGHGDISKDPMLALGWSLTTGSPCVDAGDPAPLYNDADGSRNDMGAFGGATRRGAGGSAPVGSGFLFNNVGKIPTASITQSGPSIGLANVSNDVASALSIYPHTDAPFGGSLWLHGLYGTEDEFISHYRVEIAPWVGGTRPADTEFRPLSDPLSKVNYIVEASGKVTASLVRVGPDDNGLYRRTDRVGSGYWSHPDLKLIWNTRALPNGRYDLICRSFAYIFGDEPSEVFPNQNQLSRITIHVDNSRVETSIHVVRDLQGTPVPECGMISVMSDTEEVQFEITASHPNGFMRDYRLDVLFGRNNYAGVIAVDQYAGPNAMTPPSWSGVSSNLVTTTLSQGIGSLNAWTTCAYQFRLSAWARTTDGFGHIYGSSFSDHYFVNVGGSGNNGSCPGDLDNDGDVDAQDLVIFGAFYGQTNCFNPPVIR